MFLPEFAPDLMGGHAPEKGGYQVGLGQRLVVERKSLGRRTAKPPGLLAWR